MSTYLLGIDIGTSACKVALFLDDGRVAAQDTREYAVYYPQPGWAEQDPMDWWQAVCAATRQVLAQSGIQPGEIAGVGMDGQSWSAIAVDAGRAPRCATPRFGRTLAPAGNVKKLLGTGAGGYAVCPVRQPCAAQLYPAQDFMVQKQPPGCVSKSAGYILQSNSFIAYSGLRGGCITQDVSQGYGLVLL